MTTASPTPPLPSLTDNLHALEVLGVNVVGQLDEVAVAVDDAGQPGVLQRRGDDGVEVAVDERIQRGRLATEEVRFLAETLREGAAACINL